MSSTAKVLILVYNTDMADIPISEVEKLASLSKLTVTEAEKSTLSKQLSESIHFVENLIDIDTSLVPETFFTTDAKNVMDEDEVDESLMLSHEDVMKNAAATKDGYFVIKRIL